MSLFGSINIAGNSLLVAQIGLQVTGQNIANVNTPHYSREELIVAPAVVQRFGSITLGLGVEAKGVVQKIDRFLEQRLRAATSDSASADIQKQAYTQLEQVLGELQDSDLGSSLNNFFASINEVLNQPESLTVRNLAVSQGKSLAADFSRLGQRVAGLRNDQNNQVVAAAGDVNRLLKEIGTLNLQISQSESSDFSTSDAVGLRDERSRALADLAGLIDVQTAEQTDGSVNVFSGGDFLVFGGTVRQVELTYRSDRGLTVADLRIAESQANLNVGSGKVAGLLVSRDEILGGFQDKIDQLAGTLAYEFNKVFTSGQGQKGYKDVTSISAVDNAAAPLDAAGLPFTPTNGSFQVQIYDRSTNTTQTRDISVQLNGLPNDTTLDNLVAQLNTVPGLSATISPTRQLRLRTTSSTQEVAFANDSSGTLAALGIGTFFTGSTAVGLGVNAAIVSDPAKFAASNSGIGSGTGQAVLLADFLNQPLAAIDGESLNTRYSRIVGETSQAAAAVGGAAAGFKNFEQNLRGQHLAISGVNLDEEAIKLLNYQQIYQASAKFIATVSELLDVLINL
ncbi:MAG: flagellar hook-associated protein FlgK [Pirellulales bacterium]